MKTFKALLLLPAILLMCSMSCQKNDDDVICTDMFSMVMVQVTNHEQHAPFDDIYTVRVGTGEKIRMDQPMSEGRFVVLDDSYRKRLVNSQDTFRFTLAKGGQKVLERDYVICADRCHIQKVSGPETARL